MSSKARKCLFACKQTDGGVDKKARKIMEREKQKQMILKENVWKVAWQLSWPAVIAMVLYGLNTVFDALFVGRFVGESALAGVSLAYPLTQVTLGLGSLVGAGAGSALSIALGKNDKDMQKKLLGNVNYLNVMVSVAFMIVGLIFSKQLVQMMGGAGEELVYGTNYFRITVFGTYFWVAGLAGNMIIRGEGKMKSAAVMMAIGLVVNVIANYILIVIFEMGVEGAAIGTNIGMAVYTLTSFVYFGKGKASFEARAFTFRRDKEIVASIMSMGIPSMISSVMSLLQAIVVLNAITNYGTMADVAFYGVVYRIFMFMLTPIFGLMRALQPAVGINYGAGKAERVVSSFKVFTAIATLLLLPFWIVMMSMPEAILHTMLPAREFLSSEIMNFRIFMMLLPILPIVFMGMTFFPAIDNGKIASVIGMARQLVFYLPVMLLMPKFFGIKWVYIGSFLIDAMIVLITILLVSKEFKKLRKNTAMTKEAIVASDD